MKKTLSCILICTLGYTILTPRGVFAEESCEYMWKFEQCMQANKNGTTRSIKDFICLQSNDSEAILDQIILDVKFQEIDDEVMQYLEQLESDKGFAAHETNEAIDDTTNNLSIEGVYYKKYKDLCNGWILAERVTCTGSIPVTPAWERIKGSFASRECMNLVNNKLDIYLWVADNVLKLNKNEVLQDGHKEYVQKEREKYDELLNTMLNIIGHAGRLARWLTHTTKHPLQSAILERVLSQISKLT